MYGHFGKRMQTTDGRILPLRAVRSMDVCNDRNIRLIREQSVAVSATRQQTPQVIVGPPVTRNSPLCHR